MKSDILNARDCGTTPGFRYDKTDRVALQRAADEMRCAGGRTIYIPTGVCEFAGAAVEISTAASAAGTLRTHGGGSATVVQSVGSNLFVLTDALDSRFQGSIPAGGLREVPPQIRSFPKSLKGH